MPKFSFPHRAVYKCGVIGIFVFFMAVTIVVVVIANTRKSGSTGIDASRMRQVRYEASHVVKASPYQRIAEEEER